ncbi:hypothetical protein B0O99DRAFT_602492 [Bisporella sp. PMI_857]|nr:hypothetical protein B0O99DRAFT_602492 [Bisporella sp. PMI_857]
MTIIFWKFGYDGGVISGFLAMLYFGSKYGAGVKPDGSKYLTSKDISISIGTLFIFESPTYSLIKGRDDLAEKSLRSVRGSYTETETQAELDALRAQKSLREQEDQVPWTERFEGVNLRRTLLAPSIEKRERNRPIGLRSSPYGPAF